MPVATDLAHGGRWTSLHLGGREWLWSRPDPRRGDVRPGDAFVDVGGVEECFPTVRGTPDHGDAWSRAWERVDDVTAAVTGDGYRLERALHEDGDRVRAEYRLAALPGLRFLWAAHALLAVADGATLDVPGSPDVRVFAEAAPWIDGGRPADAPHLTAPWPRPLGLDLGRFGPVDGTAVSAVVLDTATAVVRDGPDTLTLTLEAPDQPVSVALWRNLGGFPPGQPYRSIGVEPMLGRHFDLAQAAPGDCAVVPPSGELTWTLTVAGGALS